jgi:gamma-glutamyl hydrolase
VLAPSITAADYPVIGILTSPAHWSAFPCSQYSFILSSYVKQIEASGGRSIAIPYDGKRNELDDLFSKINGIVFTGGSVNLNITIPNDGSSLQFNKYTETATYLFRKAIEANKKGDYFPIWGTC